MQCKFSTEVFKAVSLINTFPVVMKGGNGWFQEAITGMAMRKEGITDKYYLDPRTSGQDPVPGQRMD